MFDAGAGGALAEPQSPPPTGIERIDVLGVRSGALRRDPSVSGERVEFAEFEALQLRLDEILAELPGVQVRRFGGAGERSELSIRGSTSAQSAVTLDGVRLDSLRTGSVDLATLPAELFESLELARGSGVAVGSGAIGGHVALRTRSASAEPVTQLRVAGGSFDTWEGSAFRSERVGALDVALGYAGFRSDGDYSFERPVLDFGGTSVRFDPPTAERVNNRAERHSALALARLPLGETLALRWLDHVTYLSRGEPGLDAGSGALAGQRSDAHSRSLRNVAQLALEAEPQRLLSLRLRAYHRFERSAFRDPIPLFATGDPIDSESDDSSLGGALESDWRRDPETVARALAGGVEARLEANAGNGAVSSAGPLATERHAERRSVTGVWLRGELAWPGSDFVRLVPSLRLDATEGFGVHWLPALGLVIEPAPWLRLRAHAERAFRAPSFDELFFPDQGFARGNPALDAERADLADAGAELAFDELGPLSDVELGASVFLHEIDDSIVWFLVSPTTLQPQNTGRARERGVELAASAALTRWLGLSANATWLDADFDATGVALPGRAPFELSARARLGDVDRYLLRFEVQRTGRISVNEGGTQRLPARTRLDASFALNLAELPGLAPRFARSAYPGARLWASVRARNLSDVALRDAAYFPQPGRTLSFGIEASY
jgi:vitamin B12 transporter